MIVTTTMMMMIIMIVYLSIIHHHHHRNLPFHLSHRLSSGLTVCRSKLHSSKFENIIYLWVHVSGEASYLDTQLTKDPTEATDNNSRSTSSSSEENPQQQQLSGQQRSVKSTNRQWWFSWWVLTITAQVMDLHMSLTLRLDLIDVNEYDSFYWYWDYICNAASHTMEKLRTNRYLLDKLIYQSMENDREKAILIADQQSKKNKGKGKQSKNAVTIAPLPAPPTMKSPSLREMMFRGD